MKRMEGGREGRKEGGRERRREAGREGGGKEGGSTHMYSSYSHSTGLMKLVETFLASSAEEDEGEGGREGGPGRSGAKSLRLGPEELTKQLASDEGCCYLIEDSTSGKLVLK